MNRRVFLGCVSAASLLAALPELCQAWVHGSPPTNATIPVTSLTNGTYAANNWAGFTTPITSVTSHVITPSPNSQQIFATTTGVWRDSEVSTYMAGRGTLYLRLGSDNQAIYASFNTVAGNSLKIGIIQNFVNSPGSDNGATGNFYPYYNNSNPSGTLTGYGVTGSVYTFGTNGFEIYLKINGTKVISYVEWRLCRAGQMAVWAQSGASQDIVATYLPLQFLYSSPGAVVFDPRDFGMRDVAATTGSMTIGSNQISGVTAGTFRIGDQVIVTVGGETGAGAYGTIGVGGTWPALNYPNTTAMNSDTSQAVGTFAYDASSNPLTVYAWNGSVWTHSNAGGGGGYTGQSYYTQYTLPLPLIATVTNVVGTTVTLNTTAAVATTSANIRLDCLPSFYVLNQAASPTSGSFAPTPANMTISIPSSQTTADQCWYMSDAVTNLAVNMNTGLTIKGAGRTLTTFKAPKCCPPGAFAIVAPFNNTVVSDFKYIGNNGANGAGFSHGVNTYSTYTPAIIMNSLSSASTGLVIKNIDGVDTVGSLATIEGSGPLIDNCTITMNGQQFDYMGWQIQLADSMNGIISNCTATGTYLLKSFEVFACTGSTIINCGGSNPLYSTNSSTSWTIDCRGLTVNYTTDSWINSGSGAIDEAIFNINDNAFGSGDTGTLKLGRHIQNGFVRTSDSSSLKFIQIASTQTGISIVGAYPGAGGCTTALDGLLQAPDFVSGSPEFGSMAVYSDAASTSVTGIRIKGTAIGTPGHSGHFGNISILGATSSATNNVADVIQSGPTLSGNQTNAAYGGC